MLGAFHHGLVASSRITTLSTSTWKVKSGSYIGTGASLGIAGLGFRPQFLLIKATGATANDDPVIAWSGMANSVGTTPAAVVIDPSTAGATGIVTGYDSDGFTVGASNLVNTLNQQYYYFAIAGGTNELKTGSYAGNSTDNTNITGITFQPKCIFLRRRNLTTNNVIFRHEGMTGDFSYQLGNTANGVANQIQSFISDGFQIGNGGGVNTAGATYDYVAFSPPIGYGYFSAYTGNGIAGSDMVTGLTFTPEMVMIKGNSTVESVIRGLVHSGDSTTRLSDSLANNINRVTQFNSDGFRVGTAAEVNSSTTTYHYMVFRTS